MWISWSLAPRMPWASFLGLSVPCRGFLFTSLSSTPDCKLNEGRNCGLFSLFSASSAAQHTVNTHWMNEHGNKQINQLNNELIDESNLITHQEPYMAQPTHRHHFLAFPSFPSWSPLLNLFVLDTTQPLPLCNTALDWTLTGPHRGEHRLGSPAGPISNGGFQTWAGHSPPSLWELWNFGSLSGL